MSAVRDAVGVRGRARGGPAGEGRRDRRDSPWGGRIREAALVGVAALLYSLVRGLTDDRVSTALGNAAEVVSFERSLGLFREADLQRAITGSDVAVDAANAVYIAYWPIVVGTLVWLLVRHPARYGFFRTALMASGALSLLVFAVFPLAPPRFVAGYGFVDTIAARSGGYRQVNASALVNEYAAMPSLHVGWVLLAGIAVIVVSRRAWVRVVAAVLPMLMWAATVLTGNHYFVDGLAGAAVVVLGLMIAIVLDRRRQDQHHLSSG